MSFEDLGLSEAVLTAVAAAGYSTPTPIQEQAIPTVLMGRDVLGCAQTGTGKTAGFTLPMIDILASGRAKARMPRSLILEPTRELAQQVAENFIKYGQNTRLTHALLIGGESFKDQQAALERGVDVLIATPGRMIDLFERGKILLADCKILVIDEADRMLDMGFIPDVEKIAGLLPPLRQTLFFSATMPPEIKKLADKFLSNPKSITVARPATTASTVQQFLVETTGRGKRDALRRLIAEEEVSNAIIFCNRKRDIGVVARALRREGARVGELHGDLPQSARTQTLEGFRAGEIHQLVASDVAARGIDISGLSHVFNYDIPTHPEDYVHRIGRTGRAGAKGRAFTLITDDDAKYVVQIEKLTGNTIPRVQARGAVEAAAREPAPTPETAETAPPPTGRSRGRRRSSREREEEAEEAVAAGMGDDPPAFILRSVADLLKT